MPCTYTLINNDNNIYIGSSRENSPATRLKSHNAGKTKSTKTKRPWKILFYETYITYTEARQREIFLKSGQGRKYIRERWQSGRMRQS
ncbi:MAG: GIY-YIG nuclease family protein [Candidatus Komeilibacteria bacterium]